MGYRPSVEFLRDGGGNLSYSLSLQSAFEDVEASCITNSKFGFCGCIDYIWLTQELHGSQLQRLCPLATSSVKQGVAHRDLPASLVGPRWPSDHWPLVVDLALA